jgi:hypothetical protein
MTLELLVDAPYPTCIQKAYLEGFYHRMTFISIKGYYWSYDESYCFFAICLDYFQKNSSSAF